MYVYHVRLSKEFVGRLASNIHKAQIVVFWFFPSPRLQMKRRLNPYLPSLEIYRLQTQISKCLSSKFGPRNCIGQELSLLEMKLALVMAIRRFDFSARFDE